MPVIYTTSIAQLYYFLLHNSQRQSYARSVLSGKHFSIYKYIYNHTVCQLIELTRGKKSLLLNSLGIFKKKLLDKETRYSSIDRKSDTYC